MSWKQFFKDNFRLLNSINIIEEKETSNGFDRTKEISDLLDIIERKIEEFMKTGFKLLDKNCNLETPLHITSKLGYLGVVKILIDKGADVNAIDIDLNTPLHLAFREVFSDKLLELTNSSIIRKISIIITILIDNGANINAKNIKRITPLHLATEKGIPMLVETLINKGADLDIENNLGDNPFHYACKYGYLKIVKIFISKSININVLNHCKRNSLHLAVQYDHPEIVKILLDNYININSIDDNNDTPIDIARMFKNYKMIELLKDKKKSETLNSSNENLTTLSRKVNKLLNRK